MDQDQTTDAQAAPSTPEVAQAAPSQAQEADAKLRAENAKWRLKVRELEGQLGEMQTQLGQYVDYDAVKAKASALEGQLQSTNLDLRLRGELAALGVTDAAKQTLLIAATRSGIDVTFGDDHKPVGDLTEPLRAAVETLGLGAAATPSEPAEQPPAAPKPPATPEPITATPRGPVTMDQRNTRALAALNAARAGKT
jgi:hypothetical protein